MAEYVKYGQATIFSNEEANEENKRPNFTGSIDITETIPSGTKLRIAGWANKQGQVLKSIGLSLSSKVGDDSDNTYDNQKSGKSYTTKVDGDVPF